MVLVQLPLVLLVALWLTMIPLQLLALQLSVPVQQLVLVLVQQLLLMQQVALKQQVVLTQQVVLM